MLNRLEKALAVCLLVLALHECVQAKSAAECSKDYGLTENVPSAIGTLNQNIKRLCATYCQHPEKLGDILKNIKYSEEGEFIKGCERALDNEENYAKFAQCLAKYDVASFVPQNVRDEPPQSVYCAMSCTYPEMKLQGKTTDELNAECKALEVA